MKTTFQEAPVLEKLEQILVEHKVFGNSSTINYRLIESYKRQLGFIADSLPLAKELLLKIDTASQKSITRLLGNTVTRCAIQQSFALAHGVTNGILNQVDVNRVFTSAIKYLGKNSTNSPFNEDVAQLEVLGDESITTWIWNESKYPGNLYGQLFRKIVKHEYKDSLTSTGDLEISNLHKGHSLLLELVPDLYKSTIEHVHTIGCFSEVGFWAGKASSSQFRTGGTIFLCKDLLSNPWWIAEHLLHEALHQKFYDIKRGYSILVPDYSENSGIRICSPWNSEGLNKSNRWNTHRTFAAFHVYVHLTLLAQIAEIKSTELIPKYGVKNGILSSKKAFERAFYLGEKLKEDCWSELGLAGKEFVEFLRKLLNYLNPNSPPQGAYLHLVLDLYQKEVNEIDNSYFKDRLSEPNLQPLAIDEINRTKQILKYVKDPKVLSDFESEISKIPNAKIGASYKDIRLLIANKLLLSSKGGYTLNESSSLKVDLDDLVKALVNSSSQKFYFAMSDLPYEVELAKTRAENINFYVNCDDHIGRLLSVLAASINQKGRILEIGTGVGVGAAWICSGLKTRNDFEFISIEADTKLFKIANHFEWPPSVKLVSNYAEKIIPNLGKFDLIFADASPFKYDHLDLILNSLNIGGILVVDDLRIGKETSKSIINQINSFKAKLLSNTRLKTVELDWSTGIILATLHDN